MQALFVVLGSVLAFAGVLLGESLRNRRAARIAALVIVLELQDNERRADPPEPESADRFVMSRAAFETHGPALAVRASLEEMVQLAYVYDAYGVLERWAHDPELEVRIDRGRSVLPLVNASMAAQARILSYTVPPWVVRKSMEIGGSPRYRPPIRVDMTLGPPAS